MMLCTQAVTDLHNLLYHKGSSLVLHTINGEDFLLSFGGYSGRYSNEACFFIISFIFLMYIYIYLADFVLSRFML
jgi:hypothetical protein